MSDHLPWDAQQREWLAALGHDLLALALAPADTGARVGAPAALAPREPERPAERDSARERSSERPVERAAAASGPMPATAARAPVGSALLRALAQAARRAPDDGEFLRALPPLASLRGNPAARRALWPRLRALRRGAPP
jgi:hypothetical protein